MNNNININNQQTNQTNYDTTTTLHKFIYSLPQPHNHNTTITNIQDTYHNLLYEFKYDLLNKLKHYYLTLLYNNILKNTTTTTTPIQYKQISTRIEMFNPTDKIIIEIQLQEEQQTDTLLTQIQEIITENNIDIYIENTDTIIIEIHL